MQWVTQVITWQPINLTTIGVATSYGLQSASLSGGTVNNSIYIDTQYAGIWVLVIEVQLVLINPYCPVTRSAC